MLTLQPNSQLLIVLFGAIGDVIRALPLAVRIKHCAPQVTISWAVESKSKGILEQHPAVDRIYHFRRERGISGYLEFLRSLRQNEFDLALDLQRHFKSGVTSLLSRSVIRLGFNRANAKEFNWIFNNQHIAAEPTNLPKIVHYQRFGDMLSLPKPEVLDHGFRFAEEDVRALESKLAAHAAEQKLECVPVARRVALIIGSSWKTKNWLAERYIALIKHLREQTDLLPILIGGAGELAFAAKINGNSGVAPALDLVNKLTLRELAVALSRMGQAVGSDSGPSHLAAAVGTPVTTLWGPTDPHRNSPYGCENLVLQSAIGCAPCLRRNCPGLDNLCMSDIPSDAVFARIQSVLAESNLHR